MSEPPVSSTTLSIAAVERDTRLSKDTLRVWERRYGFPTPQRDALGERAYSLEQVEKLRLIKRLLGAGHRPGRIAALSIAELQRLADGARTAPPSPYERKASPDLIAYVDLLRLHDVDSLRRQLSQALMRLGLARFVTDLVSHLNTQIGDAWMRGQLEVFEEHVYSETLQAVLRQALAAVPAAAPTAGPRALLTTVPGEPHALGLLMAEALFALEGSHAVSLGPQTPIWDIVLAARAYRADIVALSFTGTLSPNQIVESLAELRSKLPPAVELWAGGAAPVLQRRPQAGVQPVAALDEIVPQLLRWRETHP